MMFTAALSRGNVIWALRGIALVLSRLLGWAAVTFAAIVTVGWVYGCLKFLFWDHWRFTLALIVLMFGWWVASYVANCMDRRRNIRAVRIVESHWDDLE